jgi:gas vesicle protein
VAVESRIGKDKGCAANYGQEDKLNHKGGNMQSSNRQESGNLSIFITGALVGAGIALLFAPQSGTQMRGLLRDYASRAKDELDEAVDQGAEALDSTIERGQEFVEKGKESLREAGRQAKGFGETGKQAMDEAKDELTSQRR